MATTLQEYEARIAKLERGEMTCYDEMDESGTLTPRAPEPTDICAALYEIEGTIRRTAWSGPYQGWARELIARSDTEVRRLCEVHGLVYSGRAPLFPGHYNSQSGSWTAPIP